MPQIKLTNKDRVEIIELNKKGWNNTEIAKKFGINPAWVGKILKDMGLKSPRSYGKKKHVKKIKPLTRQQEIDAVELLMQGERDAEIAYRLGVKLDSLRLFMEMPRKKTKSYTPPKKKRGRPSTKVPLIPCPFTSCSARGDCKDIEEPQQCQVWRMYAELPPSAWTDWKIKNAIRKPEY